MPPSQPTGSGSGVRYRPLRRFGEYDACVALQRRTWGDAFSDRVPAAMLFIGQEIGGFVGGAFAGEDELLGFVFGLPALEDSAPYHWSHMLAVSREARGRGIGLALKLLQRRAVLDRGLDRVCWTFDPLEARNAHLNLNRLGGSIVRYVADMYGADTGSPLHEGIGTDRLVIEWRLNSDRAARALETGTASDLSPFAEAPIALRAPAVGTHGSDGEVARTAGGSGRYPEAPRARIAVPRHIQDFKVRHPHLATAWRVRSRHCFTHYLDAGYEVVGLSRPQGEDVCYYCLEGPSLS